MKENKESSDTLIIVLTICAIIVNFFIGLHIYNDDTRIEKIEEMSINKDTDFQKVKILYDKEYKANEKYKEKCSLGSASTYSENWGNGKLKNKHSKHTSIEYHHNGTLKSFFIVNEFSYDFFRNGKLHQYVEYYKGEDRCIKKSLFVDEDLTYALYTEYDIDTGETKSIYY